MTTSGEAMTRQRSDSTEGNVWSAVRGMVSNRPFASATAALVVGQALWLGYLMLGGWFYQADFDNLAAPAQSSLTWSYLTSSQGGHLGPIGRPVFWLIQRTFGLDYVPTIVVRLVLQAGATVLLAKLLFLLVGRRWAAVAVLAGYCFSPLLVPGAAWLTSGVGLSIFQPLFVLALISWLQFNRTSSFGKAFMAGLCLLIGTAAFDGAFAAALALPLLSFGWGYQGNFRQRIRGAVTQWWGRLVLLVPLMAYAAVIVLGGYADAASTPVPASGYARLAGTAVFKVLCPSIVGAPWRWSTPNDNYLAFADPPLIACLLGAGCWLGLLVIGVRRIGRIAILAWMLPIVVEIAAIMLVGAGRYNTFGTITALAYRYAFILAVPMTLGIALALLPAAPYLALSPEPAPLLDSTEPEHATSGRLITLVGVLTASIMLSSCVSGITFRHAWSHSPTKEYVTALKSDLKRSRDPNVYDVYTPDWLIPAVETHRHLSDLLSIDGSGIHLNHFGTKTTLPGRDGHLVPATFLPSAHAASRTSKLCVALLQGEGSWIIPMSGSAASNEWFLRVEFFQARPSNLYFSLASGDSGSEVLNPVSGARVDLNSRLDALWLRFPTAAPRAVIVSSRSAQTNICLTKVEIGYPFATGSAP
jgi:hypothetical protein